MYPLNLLIIEQSHLDVVNASKILDDRGSEAISPGTINPLKSFPLKFLYVMNNVIVTCSEENEFYYIKNRHNGESEVRYPMSKLPQHIRRIHRSSGNSLTIKDKCIQLAFNFLNKIG